MLLDGKRSLNVNIFLKQFRRFETESNISIENPRDLIRLTHFLLPSLDSSSNDNIIQLIKEGCHDDIGAEKLRGLLKILPEVDELEMLKSFDGDKSKLGNAEKFFLQLVQVPK